MRAALTPGAWLARFLVGTVSFGLLAFAVTPAGAAELPPGPGSPAAAPSPVDAYATYEGQTTCDPTPKPGAEYVLSMIVNHYRVGRAASSSISRDCASGGQSEHKEGRALDWNVNAANPTQKAAGDQLVGWLTAPGPDDKVGYNARRLGVMYIIWNGQIWNNTSSSATWKPYTGANPHTDHVHISLTWNGAYMRSSWWTGTAIPTEATSRRYVGLVYQDLFNRNPDAGGLQTWTRALVNGTPRVAVANAITYSTEYRGGLISGVYRDFLGRDPDQSGLENWLAAMAGGWTIQQMEGGFLGSQEYYNQSGATDAGWVRRLYQHVLRRDAAEVEVQSWLDVLGRGHSRQDVAMGFVLSTERLSWVVDGYYRQLLDRPSDAGGNQTWVSAIQGGHRTEEIMGGIIASAEYYSRAENFRG